MGFIINLWQSIGSISLRTKLIISYTILIAIPFGIMGAKYYTTSADAVSDLAQKNVYEIVKKDTQIIDAKLSRISESSLSIMTDPVIYNTFKEMNPEDDASLLAADRDITPRLNIYFSNTSDVYSSQLVTSKFIFGNNTSLLDTLNYKESEVYIKAKEAKGQLIWVPLYDFTKMFHHKELENIDFENKYIYSAARVIESFKIENGNSKFLGKGIERPVLIINFTPSYYDSTLNNSIPIKDAYFFIISKSGEIIYHQKPENIDASFQTTWISEMAHNETGTMKLTINGEHMIACYDTSKVTDWITVAIIPTENLMEDILPVIKNYTIWLTIILFCASLISAFFISGMISKPVKKLISAFKRTGTGDFYYTIPNKGKGEFDYLIQKFNNMNNKIQQLIEENYESKIRENESKIMALNLQLNPHFLYNTLNIINWMAIENKQDEISRMIVSLSTMLQYTVKNSSDNVTFKEDLEWLKGYIYIMSMRFEEKFSVEYNIDSGLDNCIVPKLFLQLIVENSILHGFENFENGGILKIGGYLSGDLCCFIVEDNGKGMSANKIEQVMSSNPSAIGIKNLDNRIKLKYGAEYGVSIESEEKVGTKVVIKFPAKFHTPKNRLFDVLCGLVD